MLDFSKRRRPLPTKSSCLTERQGTTAMPLMESSPKCLLIDRDAQPSKHSRRYGLVEGGVVYATNATAATEASRRSL